jgi:drug/metabolite transporter (DMT)-like permease
MADKAKSSFQFSFRFVNWILLLSCAIIWGFSYFLIKHALTGFQPMQVAVLRILAGGIALLPFIIIAFKKIPFDNYGYVFICALAGSGIPIYLYPLAQTHLDSAVTGIINSLTPLCTYVIGILFFGLAGRRIKSIGIALGLLGAASLILFKPNAELNADVFFFCIALAAPLLYGFSSNFLKKHLMGMPSLPMTSLMYFMLLLPSIPLLFYTEIPETLQSSEAAKAALPYAIILGVFGTAVAMSLFNILIKRADIMFAASVTYLMPVVAIILGILDGEKLGWNDYLGLGLILTGVLLINGKWSKKMKE